MKVIYPVVALAFFLCGGFHAHARQAAPADSVAPKPSIYLRTAVVNGERIPWVPIPEVRITRQRVFASAEEKARYMRLRYNVMKVLPYAKFAQNRYDQLNKDLVFNSDKREQRRLIKACEKEIKDMFEREIKNLTISQGEILIKLIDRQTGSSSFEVVKDLRGGVSAFFYQSIAKVFGHNLRNKYNPEEEFEVENIIRSLEQTPNYGPAYPTMAY